MISELSLFPDGIFIPHLDEDVNLISKDRHEYEKKDSGIHNLAGNEEAVRLKIAKIDNLLLKLSDTKPKPPVFYSLISGGRAKPKAVGY